MKRIFVILSVLAVVALVTGNAFALEGKAAIQTPKLSGGVDWLAAEMPLKTWIGMPESERMKVARGFADDYYNMDKGCSYAKVKAVYNEEKQQASIYVECTERSKPKTNAVKTTPFGT